MKKNKKLLFIIWVAAFALAFIAIFTGFANGLNIQHKDAGQWSSFGYESVYKVMFVDRSSVFQNQGALIASFILLLVAVAIITTVFVLNYRKIVIKNLNLSLTIGAIVLLFVSGILMFCMCPIICTRQLYSAHYKVVLGAGPIAWGVLSMLSAGGLGAAIFVNKKLLKGKF